MVTAAPSQAAAIPAMAMPSAAVPASRVVIVGAGLGGLTAAIALRQAGMQVAVYEKTPEAWAQGGGVDLRAPAIDAFQKLGISLESLTVDRDVAQFVMENASGEVLWRKNAAVAPLKHDGSAASVARKEQDIGYSGARLFRPHLRQLLLDTLTKLGASVTFEAAFARYEASPTGGVRVTFKVGADAATATEVAVDASLLVGADGINSSVRKQLVGDALVPHGYRRIGGRIEGPVAADLCKRMIAFNASRGIHGAAKHCIVSTATSFFAGTGKPIVTEAENAGLHPAIYTKGAIGWAFTYAPDVVGHVSNKGVAAATPAGAASGGAGALPAPVENSPRGMSSRTSARMKEATYWSTDADRQAFFKRVAHSVMTEQAYYDIVREYVAATAPENIHITDQASYATFKHGTPSSLDEVIATAVKSGSTASKRTLPVTLLGDAVHPVSPWGGNGATQAIVDGIVLADALAAASTIAASAGAKVQDAILAYERDMLARGAAVSGQGEAIVKFVHAKTPFLAWLRNAALRMIPVFGHQQLPGAATGYKAPAIKVGLAQLQLVAVMLLVALVVLGVWVFKAAGTRLA